MSEKMRQSAVAMKLLPLSLLVPCTMTPFISFTAISVFNAFARGNSGVEEMFDLFHRCDEGRALRQLARARRPVITISVFSGRL